MEEFSQQLSQWWAAAMSGLAFDPGVLSQPDMVARLVLQAVLFVCSAFFSGSETALFSLSRLDLQKLRRDRHPQSETLHALLDQPRRLIISLLCGNELVNVAATANLAGILVRLYGAERAGWINVAVMFPLLLLLGEVTPKIIAVSHPLRVSSQLVAAPLSVWTKIIAPVRAVIRAVAERITTWIVGEERALENILQVDEFRTLVEDVAEEGVLDATERVLIDNLLEAAETEIVEIMTPRTRASFLAADMTVPEMVKRFTEIRHPRVPVYREHFDNLVGFVHAEDVMRLVLDDVDLTQLELEDLLRPPVVVPPTKNVDEMFDFFQAHNVRAAVVLNEFGGVEGLITMRDVIKFLFGEISEGISGQELYQEHDENVYEVPGEMKLTDFDDLTNFGIEDPRMTTIGGVVFRYLDRLPQVDDRVEMDGFVATVLAMDGHRLARVRIAKGTAGGEHDEISAESPKVEKPKGKKSKGKKSKGKKSKTKKPKDKKPKDKKPKPDVSKDAALEDLAQEPKAPVAEMPKGTAQESEAPRDAEPKDKKTPAAAAPIDKPTKDKALATPKEKAPKGKASKPDTPEDAAPKAETPKEKPAKDKAPETPKTDAAKAKPPKDKAPKDKAPKDKAPEPPKTDAAKAKPPKDKAPKDKAPKGKAPEPPKTDAAKAPKDKTKEKAPKNKAPETPKTDAAKARKDKAPKDKAPKEKPSKEKPPKGQAPDSSKTPKDEDGEKD